MALELHEEPDSFITLYCDTDQQPGTRFLALARESDKIGTLASK